MIFTAVNLTHATLTCNSAGNHDPDGDSNGTSNQGEQAISRAAEISEGRQTMKAERMALPAFVWIALFA